MAVEIERRFLVIGEQWRHHCLWQARLRQGYLSRLQDELTVRVRTSEALVNGPQHVDAGQPEAASEPSSLAVSPARHDPAPAAIPGNHGSSTALGLEPQAWLTLKAPVPVPPGAGEPARAAATSAGDSPSASVLALSRLEFEYRIPLADAQALLALTIRQVVKQRFGLDLPGGDWVLDVFEGPNAPLVVAEVELQAADQRLLLPPWCGRELTGLPQLSNAALALRPLAHWSQQERYNLLG
jgi:CYTH domain-containing protein